MTRFTHTPDGVERHKAVADVLQHFAFEHLPPHLQDVSAPIGQLALRMADSLPSCAELTVGLRKLLEAKDTLVRARLQAPAQQAALVTKEPPPDPPPPPPPLAGNEEPS